MGKATKAKGGKGKGRRVALYLRVSTSNGQSTENQVRELRAVARQRGWQVVQVHEDKGISGAKGRDQRPALDAVLKAATRGEIDLIAVWSVDRLGRSLLDLVSILRNLQDVGCGLYLHTQGLDTTTDAGRAMFGMLGIFAEYERAVLRERVNAGLARARAAGRVGGRPRVGDDVERKVRAELAKGTGILKTARLCKVGASVVQRVAARDRPTGAPKRASGRVSARKATGRG
jgi:DNA invertase Pin-like site-specific DNA recombinase